MSPAYARLKAAAHAATEAAHLHAMHGMRRAYRLALSYGTEPIPPAEILNALGLDENANTVEPADRATVLSQTERDMLTYALNQAQVRMWRTGKFTDEEQAAVVSLRRLASEAPQPKSAHLPRRGDAVEQWLKTRRNISTSHSDWHVLDSLLDQYRLHADTGTPLGEHACDGPHCECAEAQPNEESDRGDQNDERATVLLRSAESYLSALHVHAARHDNLAANYGCAGCELRDQIAAELRRMADEAQPDGEARP